MNRALATRAAAAAGTRLLDASFWLTLVVLTSGTVWLLGIRPTETGRVAMAATAATAARLDLAGATPLRAARARLARPPRHGGTR